MVGYADLSGVVTNEDPATNYLGCVSLAIELQPDSGAYDLTQSGTYETLSFWAMASSATPMPLVLYFVTNESDCQSQGCWGANFEITDTWEQYTIPLAAPPFIQLFGGPDGGIAPFDPTQAVRLEFQIQGPPSPDGGTQTYPYEMAIDQVEVSGPSTATAVIASFDRGSLFSELTTPGGAIYAYDCGASDHINPVSGGVWALTRGGFDDSGDLVVDSFDNANPWTDLGIPGGLLTTTSCGHAGDTISPVVPTPDAGYYLPLSSGGFDPSSVGFVEVTGNVVDSDSTTQYLGCAQLVLDLNNNSGPDSGDNADKRPFDLTPYSSLSFWGKFSGTAESKVEVQIPTTSWNCQTNGCWGGFAQLTETWGHYSIPLSNLANVYNYPDAGPFDPAQAVALTWEVSGPATLDGGLQTYTYDLSIDEVEFIR